MKHPELFEAFSKDILENNTFGLCKSFIQHGCISVYEHSLEVAKMSFSIGEFFKIKDQQSLVRGALLHDFFLYDWHVPEKMWSLHGWTHPVTAANNGRKYFQISDKEYSLIRSHMWPYTLLHPPRYKEGWIICLADKICSLGETIFKRG
ncbi:MAG: HD domain-containing protein [Treponema sp.]|jgi:uncharacterized protein|nr:HD domain-containing protein [Treponema sp.]